MVHLCHREKIFNIDHANETDDFDLTVDVGDPPTMYIYMNTRTVTSQRSGFYTFVGKQQRKLPRQNESKFRL
jgi:hypothetical protein